MFDSSNTETARRQALGEGKEAVNR
jgi:hypothetical protein